MKPTTALSITLAWPVAMQPPLRMASSIGTRQRLPMSERQEGHPVDDNSLLSGEEAERVLTVDRRQQVGQQVVKERASRDDLRAGGAYLGGYLPGDLSR